MSPSAATAPLARNLREWAWFIIVVGTILRFQGLLWDSGQLFNPDERNIGTGAALLAFPGALVPQFNAYNGLSLYLPRLLAEMVSPIVGWRGGDPASIVIAGRFLSALFATLTLPVLWFTARRALGSAGGLFLVACAAATPALIQSAHFATTEAVLVLCVSLLLWLSQLHLEGAMPLRRYATWTGIVLGLGFGFKTTALSFAIIPLVTVAQTRLARGAILPALGAGMLATAITVVLALLTTPQIWANPGAYFDTMRFEAGVISGTQDVFWTYQFTGAVSGLYELQQLPWLLGPALPFAALAGLVLLPVGLWKRRPEAIALAAGTAFLLVQGGFTYSWFAKFVRYQDLLIPGLLMLAAYAIVQVRHDVRRRILACVIAIVTGIAGLMQAAIYQAPDPRIAAWDWLEPQLQPGQTMVLEPVDVGASYWRSSKAPVTRVLPLIEPSGPQKLGAIAETLAAGDWMIIASRRHHAVLPRLTARFPEMCGYYDALWSGRLGYAVVGRFLRRPVLDWAFTPEQGAEETFTVFDSPEVIVLSNVGRLDQARLLAEIEAGARRCTTSRTLPTPPR